MVTKKQLTPGGGAGDLHSGLQEELSGQHWPAEPGRPRAWELGVVIGCNRAEGFWGNKGGFLLVVP